MFFVLYSSWLSGLWPLKRCLHTIPLRLSSQHGLVFIYFEFLNLFSIQWGCRWLYWVNELARVSNALTPFRLSHVANFSFESLEIQQETYISWDDLKKQKHCYFSLIQPWPEIAVIATAHARSFLEIWPPNAQRKCMAEIKQNKIEQVLAYREQVPRSGWVLESFLCYSD